MLIFGKYIRIYNLRLSQYSDKIFIIAEAAVNGFGSEYIIYKTLEAAKSSGASAVKFQHIHVEELYAPGKYKYGNYNIENVRKLRINGLMSIDQIKRVIEYAKKINLIVFFTPFGRKALEELLIAGVSIIKIASADLEYDDLVERAIETKLDLIMSTAMIDSISLEKKIDYFNRRRLYERTTFMHCVGEYPHDNQSSQIGSIKFLKDKYKGLVGYSDHTLGNEAAVSALTLGARIFEKHFVLSRSLGGLDSKHSMEPNELLKYCQSLNKFNHALNCYEREFTKQEKYTSERAMRGVYAAKSIKKGSIIKSSDLLALRPVNGYSHQDIYKLVGKVAKVDINEYEPIDNKKI